ncbi:SDR family oxidoreductase [Croceivirga thetidis]|uniref:SDR family oxidoreductase n=1 Tax=Croceivirga thetidis TaxID=2721623 RepID=A0ABX1GMN5_9FLAO|nr:SDR family oxidoreductase [Croceivirga thetidis]NKI30884.1 SDR family oxidoreductase [Croceivirga thetidis]
MNKQIGVLGCGWLGLPLAKHLVDQGNIVFGTTTSSKKLFELQQARIKPFQIELGEEQISGDINGFLQDLEILILNIPPKLRKPPFEDYVLKIKHLKDKIIDSRLKKVIFISSTSVYGDVTGEITEESKTSPNTKSGKALLECEQMLAQEQNFNTTILRFGGLIGKDRHPITFLSGKKNLTNGDDFINLIHQNDCIGIIEKVINEEHWGKVINGVYPNHPKKRDYYIAEAKKRNLQVPDFVNTNLKSTKKIIKSRNFRYSYSFPITTT